MLVPRSHLFATAPRSPTTSPSRARKQRQEERKPRLEKKVTDASLQEDSRRQAPQPMPESPPSQPVVIPSRTHNEQRDVGRPALRVLSDGSNGRSSSKGRRARDLHKPSAIPPSVAALLAVTTIPKPGSVGSIRRRSEQNATHKSLMELLEKSPLELELEDAAMNAKEVLLSSPEESEDGYSGLDSLMDRTLNARAHSTDSVPSLGSDDESAGSFMTPPTPGTSLNGGRRSGAEKKLKNMSSPPSEDAASNHPLLSTDFDPVPPYENAASDAELLTPMPTTPPLASKSKSALKSNLTASLRALKSAARSLSVFASPIIQPDDFLTRSILSSAPPYADERRPLHVGDTPAPALRRYLNPSTPARVDMAVQQLPAGKDPCTVMIQMQTYHRSRKSAKKGLSTDRHAGHSTTDESPFVQSAEVASLVARQREPRENGDFLRIIVLEMNMRREGKLSDEVPGKARIWLPPRRPTKAQTVDDGGVPTRWIGLSLAD
ncbi:hypothetical protein L228DRAFT_264947 [Xylona heveae TC161]|uniref:Uncharacterized protein n=1 Tax=Xylona heveae (strain CBS 132557 / TC161) TaxID=1328760 RepID=A0A165JSD7_XYLHT|nr:hypothetical protein L228DRAFT_264947 [Xylona heveae TC161]KZF26568.1 hypothetical protein L228DRAFT_264947 [Xylona heveae TC161]